jgi:hypothetical protein
MPDKHIKRADQADVFSAFVALPSRSDRCDDFKLWRPKGGVSQKVGGSLLVETVSDVLVPTHVKGKGMGTIQGLGAQENGALQRREAHTSNRRKILLVCGEVWPHS